MSIPPLHESLHRATDLTPRSNLAELFITYRCDLQCNGCYTAAAVAEDMQVADVREFCRQVKELCWSPRIVITGGEPTLHSAFREIVTIVKEIGSEVIVTSNAYRPESRLLLREVAATGVRVDNAAFKHTGSWAFGDTGVYVAPCDVGVYRGSPCDWHSSVGCGISVDATGYTLCPLGGVIDGALRLGVVTRRLADLFDPFFAARQSYELCRHCGHWYEFSQEQLTLTCEKDGLRLSKGWLAAINQKGDACDAADCDP